MKTYNHGTVQATYTTRPNVSPNLGHLHLRVMHMAPRGEAITYAYTDHDVFILEQETGITMYHARFRYTKHISGHHQSYAG